MTWTVTLNGGDRDVALPNGLRYQGTAQVVLSDRWYAQLSAHALSSLMSAVSAGGTAAYRVTLAAGKANVALPNGLRYSAGAVAVLSDEEYSLLTPHAVSMLFSSVVRTVG